MRNFLFVLVICIFSWDIHVYGQGFASGSGFSNGNPPPLQASGFNWSSAHALDATYGSHSGINWQSLGA